MIKLNKLEERLMEPSIHALKFWGKEVEESLPKPTITEDLALLTPSLLLLDMLKYARGAESRGEWLFRHNYLHPLFDHYSTNNTVTTTWEQDDMGNMYVQVGEVNGVLHVGHVDTVHSDDHSPVQSISVDVAGIVSLDPVIKNSYPVLKEGVRWVAGVDVKHHYPAYELPDKKKRCLGADDACALATMIYLIANQVTGTYLFTRGEEIGCVGTHYIIDNDLINWTDYSIAIEVDRKGTLEIIGNMSVGNTASQSFVTSLSEQLDMGHKMGKGTITDVGHISGYIPECVNISAGYDLQHSERETTNIVYLDKLGKALLAVDWDALNIERKAGVFYPPVAPTNLNNLNNRYNPNQYRDNGAYINRNTRAIHTAAPRNSYDDFAPEPDTLTSSFGDMYPITLNSYQREAFVRVNAGFLVEFLDALDISPQQMHNIICFGNVDGDASIDELEAE